MWQRASARPRRLEAPTLLFVMACVAGCGGGEPVAPAGATPPVFPGIVSNPAIVTAPGSSAAPSVLGSAPVAYVALPPGTVPDGLEATISNGRSGSRVTTPVVAGGFDPVAIIAQEGDLLAVAIRLLDDGSANSAISVPRRRRPVIVRTEPPPKKRDVPLNASVIIVFSEPVDPVTVSSASIRLEAAGAPVASTVRLMEGMPWIAVVTPVSELSPHREYQLVVTDQIRDLDGDAIESAIQQTFTTSALPAFGGRIAFHAWDGVSPSDRIVTMNPDGAEIAYLASGLDPSWSPDGTKIAFWRHNNGQGGIYIMNANGSSVRSVAPHGYQPTWSPDGTKLAFGCGGTCVVNADGSGLDTLTAYALPKVAQDVCVLETDPAWSPDGSTIAFTRWLGPDEGGSPCTQLLGVRMFPFDYWSMVWLMNADGSNAREIPATADLPLTSALWPAWSPDGSRLAFLHVTPDMERISIVDADGTNLRTIAQNALPPWSPLFGAPDWSPDGHWIVYGSAVAWFFADAAGSGDIRTIAPSTPPFRNVAYILWSWSRR